MTILSFPTLERRVLTSFEFALIQNTQTFTSPLNGQVQTVELPGARWTCTMGLTNLPEQDGRRIKAFLASLRGQAGRCYLWDMSHATPAGAATGTPLVNGASQTGSSIITDGWTANVTGILKAGDMIGIGGELKMVTADANSDSGGNATISFAPQLRAAPSDNSAIVTTRPTCTMKLIDDQQAKFAMQLNRIFSPSLSFTEVF